jgi:hypothetical protein
MVERERGTRSRKRRRERYDDGQDIPLQKHLPTGFVG